MQNFIDDLKNVYLKAGYIRIFDPHALKIGIRQNENIIQISLSDVAKITGHICPTVVSSFYIVKEALKSLYSDEIPTRENFLVAVPKYDDAALVFSVVLDAFPRAADDTTGTGKMFLDNNLGVDDSKLKFIFKRIDTGKTISVTWDKNIAIPPEVASKMEEYQTKGIRERYNFVDHQRWNSFVNAQVEKIILTLNPKMLTVQDEPDYTFPGEMKYSLL